MQNGHVESFNRRLRDECLNANWFRSLEDARTKISAWQNEYNSERPRSSLGYRTPNEFAALACPQDPHTNNTQLAAAVAVGK